ncbi:hypothetical protein TNCV_4260901 [Trichonephila clavipes]|nr:hypothetical protein TNCV_4260901 [Trichonephila clavipes]
MILNSLHIIGIVKGHSSLLPLACGFVCVRFTLPSPHPIDSVKGVAETSRNITARDISGEIHYLLEDSRGFRTRQHGRNDAKLVAKVAKLAANLVTKNDANLALPPRFRQVLIESPL